MALPSLVATAEPKVKLDDRIEVGLGWHIAQHGSSRWLWHDGHAGGFQGSVIVGPAAGTGIVVLANWLDDDLAAGTAATTVLGIRL